jgi:hypothetical protein
MPMPKDNLKERLSRCRQIKISVIERKSGKTISIPVWFVLEGDKLYLLPVQGPEPQWHKNVPQNPTIRIDARGVGAEFRAVRALVLGRLGWTADAAFRAISESRGCSIPDTLAGGAGSELCPQNFRVKRLSKPRDNFGRHNRTAHTVSVRCGYVLFKVDDVG